MLVAEHDGPTMFARIDVMRALNRHVERGFNSDPKDQHWGRRKLARDRCLMQPNKKPPEGGLIFAIWI
jgi:hypothetical protein